MLVFLERLVWGKKLIFNVEWYRATRVHIVFFYIGKNYSGFIFTSCIRPS